MNGTDTQGLKLRLLDVDNTVEISFETQKGRMRDREVMIMNQSTIPRFRDRCKKYLQTGQFDMLETAHDNLRVSKGAAMDPDAIGIANDHKQADGTLVKTTLHLPRLVFENLIGKLEEMLLPQIPSPQNTTALQH